MNCPVCGISMLKRQVGKMQPTKPPTYGYRYWCGEHGWQGDVSYEQRTEPISDDDWAMMAWQRMYDA